MAWRRSRTASSSTLRCSTRVDKVKAPILCLVGPPGRRQDVSWPVAWHAPRGRKFVRMALGGVRDEAEIRGHRRTYIGSMPGKVLQSLSKVGTRNPLFLLDEIDKLGMDFRGDPSSALLEVLDPEQNHTFSDHYIELDFDLSDVMFIATSNSMNIPAGTARPDGGDPPVGLHRRREAQRSRRSYLLPKQFKNNGVKDGRTGRSPKSALRGIIRYYTREAGVRSLEREISKICRKVVKGAVAQEVRRARSRSITDQNLNDFLSVRKYRLSVEAEKTEPGRAGGWTGMDRGGW